MDRETDDMLRRLFNLPEHDQTRINNAISRNTEAVFMLLLERELDRVTGTNEEIDLDQLSERALRIGTRLATSLIARQLV